MYNPAFDTKSNSSSSTITDSRASQNLKHENVIDDNSKKYCRKLSTNSIE